MGILKFSDLAPKEKEELSELEQVMEANRLKAEKRKKEREKAAQELATATKRGNLQPNRRK